MSDADDFRTTVSKALDAFADEGTLHNVLADALSTERLTTAKCPHCDTTVQLASPDYRGWLAALTAFDAIGKGKQKPAEDPTVDTQLIDEAIERYFSRLTDEQLEHLPL